MITENRQNVNTENTVECQFGNAIRELKISSLLKASNVRKKKGGNVSYAAGRKGYGLL